MLLQLAQGKGSSRVINLMATMEGSDFNLVKTSSLDQTVSDYFPVLHRKELHLPIIQNRLRCRFVQF